MVLLTVLALGCGDSYVIPEPEPGVTVPSGLWTSSGNPSAILRFVPSRLGDTGSQLPAAILTTENAPPGTLASLAFAPDGSLWIATADGSRLLRLAPENLQGNGPIPIATEIRSAGQSLAAPISLAFDHSEALWVANFDNGSLVRFGPAQLAAGGAPAPAVVVTGLGQPTSMAFDARGGLWVAENRDKRIVRYDPAQLRASGSPAPAVVLTTAGSTVQTARTLAFDARGNLWVSHVAGGSLISFSPEQLALGGAQVPRVGLIPNNGFPSVPVGLAFDADGNLWVIGGTGQLAKFARSALTVSGSPVPAIRFAVTSHSVFWSLAFWPVPDGLPIR